MRLMIAMIASALAICLVAFGFFHYRNRTWQQGNSSPATKVSRIKGKVKFLNDAKGNDAKAYGFIAQADGADVIVLPSAVRPEGFKSLREGDDVEFELVRGPKGWEARNVVKVPKANH